METVKTIEQALDAINAYKGNPEDFRLRIPHELLDETGVTMAVITDKILELGWEMDGFHDTDRFRVFTYKEMVNPITEPVLTCRNCGNELIIISQEDSSPLIFECSKCGSREYTEVQIAPPWPPAEDDQSPDNFEPNKTKTVFRFLDLSAVPVTVGDPDEDITVFPIGWIFLWLIVIAIVALIVLVLWIIF